jgi:hypothetical protein
VQMHLANEVFAVQHGLLKMTDAKWLRSQDSDALDVAIFHLWLCPNTDCSLPPVIPPTQTDQISRHTSEHRVHWYVGISDLFVPPTVQLGSNQTQLPAVVVQTGCHQEPELWWSMGDKIPNPVSATSV